MKRIRLPRYVFGKNDSDEDIDNSFGMDYIRHIENADSVGWNPKLRRWTPPDKPGYDKHSLGMGLDMRKENNPEVYNYLKEKGRLDNPYLTEAEERQFRINAYKRKKAIVNRFQKDNNIKLTEEDAAILTGMAYQGYPMKMVNTPGSVTRTAIQPLIDEGKPIGQPAFDAYYGYPANAKLYADRVKRHNAYFGITPKK